MKTLEFLFEASDRILNSESNGSDKVRNHFSDHIAGPVSELHKKTWPAFLSRDSSFQVLLPNTRKQIKELLI